MKIGVSEAWMDSFAPAARSILLLTAAKWDII